MCYIVTLSSHVLDVALTWAFLAALTPNREHKSYGFISTLMSQAFGSASWTCCSVVNTSSLGAGGLSASHLHFWTVTSLLSHSHAQHLYIYIFLLPHNTNLVTVSCLVMCILMYQAHSQEHRILYRGLGRQSNPEFYAPDYEQWSEELFYLETGAEGLW